MAYSKGRVKIYGNFKLRAKGEEEDGIRRATSPYI